MNSMTSCVTTVGDGGNLMIKIKELRVSKQLTQKALAEKLNVTLQAGSKWEREESIPDIETLFALCQYFQISLEKLLGIKKQSVWTTLFSKLKGRTIPMENQMIQRLRDENHQIKEKQKLAMIFDLTENFIANKALPFTQVFTAKLNQCLRERNLQIYVQNYSSNLIDPLGDQAEIILLTPTLSFMKSEIEKKFIDTPVLSLNKKDYGLLDIEAITEQITTIRNHSIK